MTEEKLLQANELRNNIATKKVQLDILKGIKSSGESVIELHNLSENQQAVITENPDFVSQIKQMAIEKL